MDCHDKEEPENDHKPAQKPHWDPPDWYRETEADDDRHHCRNTEPSDNAREHKRKNLRQIV